MPRGSIRAPRSLLSTAMDGCVHSSHLLNPPATHRFNRAALDQGSQSDGAPEHACRGVHRELLPAAKLVADCDGFGLPGPATTNPEGFLSSRRGGQHDLHHCSADVTARTTKNRDHAYVVGSPARAYTFFSRKKHVLFRSWCARNSKLHAAVRTHPTVNQARADVSSAKLKKAERLARVGVWLALRCSAEHVCLCIFLNSPNSQSTSYVFYGLLRSSFIFHSRGTLPHTHQQGCTR